MRSSTGSQPMICQPSRITSAPSFTVTFRVMKFSPRAQVNWLRTRRFVFLSASSHSPIAIVGLAALFPGSVDKDGFWRDIVAGRDLITEFRALAPPHTPIRIQRWSVRRVGLLMGAGFAGLLLASYVVANLLTVPS